MLDSSPTSLASGFAGSVTLLTSWGACRLHTLARLHFGNHPPAVYYDAGIEDRVPLVGVREVSPATQFVDVVIARTELGTVSVRCTPDVLFVTTRGDVPAAELLGKSIVRVLADGTSDSFVVPSVEPIALTVPIPVYRVECSADACCVGADSAVAAVVRC